jgi:hypothetical protein
MQLLMLQEQLAGEAETVTRYLFSKQEFNAENVKANAFVDSRNPSELSVFVVTQLPDHDIWLLAKAVRTDKLVKARADLHVADIHAIDSRTALGVLQVFIDGVPHPRHANIKHLPIESSMQRTIAAELANKAKLVRHT